MFIMIGTNSRWVYVYIWVFDSEREQLDAFNTLKIIKNSPAFGDAIDANLGQHFNMLMRAKM